MTLGRTPTDLLDTQSQNYVVAHRRLLLTTSRLAKFTSTVCDLPIVGGAAHDAARSRSQEEVARASGEPRTRGRHVAGSLFELLYRIAYGANKELV
jgi:hypothetical protein